jgi:hypothetical protein
MEKVRCQVIFYTVQRANIVQIPISPLLPRREDLYHVVVPE